MNPPSSFPASARRRLLIGASGLLFVLLALPLRLGANITVALGVSRGLPGNFYGSNGQARNTFDWQRTDPNDFNETFTAADPNSPLNVLGSLRLGLLRFPSGTGANYWDWIKGSYTGNFPGAGAPIVTNSDFHELGRELSESGAMPVYVFNLVSDPTTEMDDAVGGPSGPSSTDTSPTAWTYQLSPTSGIFHTASTDGLPLPFVELGNELYANNADDEAVYPNQTSYVEPPTIYAPTANAWIWNIHGQSDNTLVAACGADRSLKPGNFRRQAWNWGTDGARDTGLFSILNYAKANQRNNADAVTIHVYPAPNLAPGEAAPLTLSDCEDLVASVFVNFDDLRNADFLNAEAIPSKLPVWITEYNLDGAEPSGAIGDTGAYYGTWAHGLALGAISLKWLELLQVQMMIHHCVVGDASYGDIYSTDAVGTDGVFGHVPLTIGAEKFGLSAGGLVSQSINTAALGQTGATELTFTGGFGAGGSTLTVNDRVHKTTLQMPRLYGWEFTGAAGGAQAVILNLDGAPWTVALGSVMTSVAGYWQVGAPQDSTGAYVPEAFVTDGKRGAAYDDVSPPQNLTLFTKSKTGSLSTTITLPPFSITRIAFTPKP